jgi:hypothetical protein
VAKAPAAAIKEGLEEKTLKIVSHKMRIQKVFRFGPHTLALTVPQGSVVACMDENEMLKVMKKVTKDATLAGAVSYLTTAVDASAPPHVQMLIDPSDGSPEA